MAERGDSDSFVANKSRGLIESCGDDRGVDTGLERRMIECSGNGVSRGRSETDASKSKILEALCHAQTRAREGMNPTVQRDNYEFVNQEKMIPRVIRWIHGGIEVAIERSWDNGGEGAISLARSSVVATDLDEASISSTGLGLSLDNGRLALDESSFIFGLLEDDLELDLHREDAEFDRLMKIQVKSMYYMLTKMESRPSPTLLNEYLLAVLGHGLHMTALLSPIKHRAKQSETCFFG
ncbi:hypothetical protein SSX86_027828 [Deinandra increscens subsp. villosa]|uniref:Uncharacterized protein n=1 Tax=Deinandra increscens subsp. villosa TaxID=3103831 RepID=A0AAP0CCZ2_9ASTR